MIIIFESWSAGADCGTAGARDRAPGKANFINEFLKEKVLFFSSKGTPLRGPLSGY